MEKKSDIMTDNEIVPINIKKYAEALNNLIGVDMAYFDGDKDVSAIVEIISLAKKMESIINRQKAEIDRLIKQNARLNKECDHYIDFASTARAEAIKEFAERLKAEGFRHKNFGDLVQFEDIDCLVKEMTEEETNADIDGVV